MASRLADARLALHTALRPVLPGRVDAYPPAAGRPVAPKVWIGDVADGDPATIGSSTTVTLARFPVVVVYDGAVHAQVAGLDDLVSAVVDAVEAAPGFEHDGWRARPFGDLPVDSTIRSIVVTATVTITARTLCLPTPDVVTVPPTPIGA
jgi:hypothetical protein